jgi:hypothetical protein
MKSGNGPPDSRTQSAAFLATVFVLLLSALAQPGVSLANLSDNFRWRKELISLHNGFRLQAGDRVFHDAIIGTDGWEFYTSDLSLPEYQRIQWLDSTQLKRIQVRLGRLRASLASQGRTLLVVIAPDKSSIYPAHMPTAIPVIGESSGLDRLDALMSANEDHTVLDLRQALFRESAHQDVYYKTDTHWNDLGAYYAYVEIMHALASARPELEPRPLSEFRYAHIGGTTRDLSMMLGVPQLKEDTWTLTASFETGTRTIVRPVANAPDIQVSTGPDITLPRLLIIHDSFYQAGLQKLMEPHFSTIIDLPLWPHADAAPRGWLTTESPDIVVIEMAERFMDQLLPVLDLWSP